MMVPAGAPDAVNGRGVALKLAGELPIEQVICAPVQHCNPIVGLPPQIDGRDQVTVVSPG
jgi:hypothetical protein